MRIIIGADRVQQLTVRYQAAFGNIAFPDNHLPGIGRHIVGVDIQVADDTVYLHALIDIPRYDAVIKPFFRKVFVIIESAFIRKKQGTLYIAFDSRLVGRKRKEELVETPDMLPGFHRTVLRQVLRKGEHQRLSVVEYIDLLALCFRKAVGAVYGVIRNDSAQAQEDKAEDA